MADEERPDAACVVVPPEHLVAAALPLLERGVPLLVEKPPGRDPAELEALIEAAAKTGTAVQVGFNRRFIPLFAQALRILRERLAPEEILQIDYDLVRAGRFDADFAVTAVHGLDAALCLAGSRIRRARVFRRRLAISGRHASAVAVEAECESGALVRCTFRPVAGALWERATLHGSSESLTLDLPIWNSADRPGLLRWWENGALVRELRGPEEPDFRMWGFYGQWRAFIDGVRAGRKLIPSLADAREAVALMAALRDEGCEEIEFPANPRVAPRGSEDDISSLASA